MACHRWYRFERQWEFKSTPYPCLAMQKANAMQMHLIFLVYMFLIPSNRRSTWICWPSCRLLESFMNKNIWRTSDFNRCSHVFLYLLVGGLSVGSILRDWLKGLEDWCSPSFMFSLIFLIVKMEASWDGLQRILYCGYISASPIAFKLKSRLG